MASFMTARWASVTASPRLPSAEVRHPLEGGGGFVGGVVGGGPA